MRDCRRIVALVAVALLGGVAVRLWRPGGPGRALANFRLYSAPSAGIYDSLATRFLGGFFRQVARETGEIRPRGRILDVGAGPGRLAVALARTYTDIRIVGVDPSPEMVERARETSKRAGLDDRVSFEQGNAVALPFPDASFDDVLSTLSMHHWPDPARGLAEVYRVLRPGGVARIYDVVDWIRRSEDRGAGITDLASRSPFGGAIVETVVRLGPIPIVQRAELRKGASRG